jgi:hypothetical protein
MTTHSNERVLRLRKGEVIYIAAPPYKPILIRIDPKVDDIVIEEIDPQDVPETGENASVTFPNRSETPEPEVLVSSTVQDPQDFAVDPIDLAIENGTIQPVFPERFNKNEPLPIDTAAQHKAAVAKTISAETELYKHEKVVHGAIVFGYTRDPVSPYDRKPEPENVQPAPAGEPQQPDLLQSDIPFDLS